MTETHETQEQPYWQYDTALCEGVFMLCGEEPYRKRDINQEITPVGIEQGMRTSIHMKPYVLIPTITLTVGLFDRASSEGAIGTVAATHEGKKREMDIGQGQAYSYPDGTIVLWECYLFEPFYKGRMPDTTDPNFIKLWVGFQHLLTEQFPEASRMVTPSREPLFDDCEYKAFLTGLGYNLIAKAAYGKSLTRN